MGSFGDRLRREREMRGVTLDEISASTKIARRHLEALESENFDTLPGGIFNRGFVRSYARFLGIDEEQAVADYNEASGEQTQPEPSFPLEFPLEDKPQLNPRRSSVPLLLALLALVIVLGIFWARSKRQPEASENPPASSPTEPPPAAPTPATAASAEPVASQAAVPARTPAPVQSVPVNSPEAVEPTHSPTPVAGHTFSVTVQAKEEAWITVTADGQTVVSGKTLQAGERQVVHAGKKIVLVTGNAGGIEISFNGRSLGAVGSESEVRAMTFTPSGLVQ